MKSPCKKDEHDNNVNFITIRTPPHMDTVTGLTIVKDKLISGSKDKNLRLWALDHLINNAKHNFSPQYSMTMLHFVKVSISLKLDDK